jgi:hypothetical protein
MAALREADGPVAVSRIARTLALEIETDLDRDSPDPPNAAQAGLPTDAADEAVAWIEMAVYG